MRPLCQLLSGMTKVIERQMCDDRVVLPLSPYKIQVKWLESYDDLLTGFILQFRICSTFHIKITQQMNEQQFQRFISKTNSNTSSRSQTERHESVRIDGVPVLRQKSFRLKCVSIDKMCRISVQSPVAQEYRGVSFDFDVFITPVLGANSFRPIKWWTQAQRLVNACGQVRSFFISNSIMVDGTVRSFENGIDFNLQVSLYVRVHCKVIQ